MLFVVVVVVGLTFSNGWMVYWSSECVREGTHMGPQNEKKKKKNWEFAFPKEN